MSYNYYSTDSSHSDGDDGGDGDGDCLTECRYCGYQLLQKDYRCHLDNEHKCEYCPNYMSEASMQGHIERKHMMQFRHCSVKFLEHLLPHHVTTHFTTCEYCELKMFVTKLNQHLVETHPFRATVGMIQVDKISNIEFNRLVEENRIYAKHGHIFLK